MTDRRGYSFPAEDSGRSGQWTTGSTQQPSRYSAQLSPYQGGSNAYPTMGPAMHNMVPVHSPSVQYGMNDHYTGSFPPTVSSQYVAATPNTYHQPRQSYPSPDHHTQHSNAMPHYSMPSHQYPAQHLTSHQHSLPQTSSYFGRGDAQHQQPQYPASPSRPFSCDLCALSFNRQHDLKRHRETHSGEKPFLCNGGCGKTFTRKDALKRHQLVKHCGHEDDI
ncbi:hypothetical protein BS17DRAFT_783049 [Gyrodon lividus]|nr:hypothetical protein BS17DRAFT_783049 [Gyrodon lividus]